MANKQYKDFTAGAFANDQIIAQQSLTDDSYTKVPVPTFGLGDNVANEARTFEFDGETIDLNATDTSGTGASLFDHSENGYKRIDAFSSASGDDSFLEMVSYQITWEVSDITEANYCRSRMSQDDFLLLHKDGAGFTQQKIDTSGLEQKIQDDEISPTVHSVISATQSEIMLLQENVSPSNSGALSVRKDKIQTGVTDGSTENNIYLDAEVASYYSGLDAYIEYYNSERRLYLSTHLIRLGSIGNYASNALALAAGLQIGDIYRTAGVLMIVI
jgi:hypothetical protein